MPNQISSKSRGGAFLLCFFFGFLGLHRFYVRDGKKGVIMLLCTISVVLSPISGVWALVDLFRILFLGNLRDGDGNLVSKW